MDVLALVSRLTACDPPTAARRDLEGCAEASARVRAWLDGFDVEIGRALEVKSGYGAKVLADAMKLSLAGGTRVIERGETLREVPAVEEAVHAAPGPQGPPRRDGVDQRRAGARRAFVACQRVRGSVEGRGAPLARR